MPTKRPAEPSSETLEVFPNPSPENSYVIRIRVPEFTCLCPMTGQPDFATLAIEYVADEVCVELKSLKIYVWSYREVGAFHEAVTNQILDHLRDILKPRFIRVTAEFNVRGGIYTTVSAEHRKPDWQPPEPVDFPK